jgi:ATP-dependent RNA helicase DDX27
MSPSL